VIFLRSILFYIGEALSTIPFVMIAAVAVFCRPRTRSRMIAGWAIFVTWWLRLTTGLKHDIQGMGNLPDEPCVIACAHQSTWETIATQTFLPPLAWVLKKELFRIPLFGWGLWATRPIAIDRSDHKNALDQVVEQGAEKLLEGRYVLIFPQGTRTPYGESGRYKKGAAKLAMFSNVPIVPVAHNAGKFWSNKSLWIQPGTIQCVFGEPIQIDGKSDEQLTTEIQNWIEAQDL